MGKRTEVTGTASAVDDHLESVECPQPWLPPGVPTIVQRLPSHLSHPRHEPIVTLRSLAAKLHGTATPGSRQAKGARWQLSFSEEPAVKPATEGAAGTVANQPLLLVAAGHPRRRAASREASRDRESLLPSHS